MELLLLVLVPFPLGLLLRNQLVAYISYIAVHGFAFTIQTLYLTLWWANGSDEAFGKYPKADTGEIVAYGGINLAIFVAGLGLVALGHWSRARYRVRHSRSVDLDEVVPSTTQV